MYDAPRAMTEALRLQFERQLAAREPEARTIAAEYMAVPTAFVNACDDGPGADPRQMAVDTRVTIQARVYRPPRLNERDHCAR